MKKSFRAARRTLAEQTEILPFPRIPVRINFIADLPPCRGEIRIGQGFLFVAAGEHETGVILVLLFRERARRIHKQPALFKTPVGGEKYALLPLRARFDVFPRPVKRRLRLFAHHALSRAGRVDDNYVKRAAERLGELFRAHVGHEHVRVSRSDDVLAQCFGARAIGIVGYEQSAPAQSARRHAALTSRGGAHVQHFRSAGDIRIRDGQHRRRFLHIIQPRAVIRVRGRRAAEHFVTPLAVRQLFYHEAERRDIYPRRFDGIKVQTFFRAFGQCGDILLRFPAQTAFDFFDVRVHAHTTSIYFSRAFEKRFGRRARYISRLPRT